MLSRFHPPISTFIAFFWWIISHFMNLSHFVYPLISWWVFGLFPLCGYYKCCYKHLWTLRFPMHLSILNCQVVWWLCMTFWGTVKLFSKPLELFYIPTCQCMRVPISLHPYQLVPVLLLILLSAQYVWSSTSLWFWFAFP